MHPILISSRNFSAVLVLWSLVCCFGAALIVVQANMSMQASVFTLSIQGAAIGVPWYAVLLFVCMSSFYICLRLPLKSTRALIIFLIQVFGAVVAICVWLLLGYIWAWMITALDFNFALSIFKASLWGNVLVACMLYGFWVLLHYVYLTTQEGEQKSQHNLAQKLLVSEVELQAIKATVHPHFLYNSLNMLANLSLVAPEKIHPLCVQMSDFLRYSISYGNKKHVTLKEEVEHISNYLNIERERFGTRLQVSIDVPTIANDIYVFPLLLFPLVENCIKHGVDTSVDTCHVHVSIKLSDTKVIIKITNSLDPEATQALGTRHGLASLAKRLRNYFGESATMTINHSILQFEITLEIPASGLVRLEVKDDD